MSALILVSIAHGEGNAAPEPPIVSAPDEGETLPLGEGIDTAASAAPDAREGTIELTDSEAGALIALALGQKLETKEVTAHFYAPDGVRVGVTVTREALRAFLEREPAGVPPALGALRCRRRDAARLNRGSFPLSARTSPTTYRARLCSPPPKP